MPITLHYSGLLHFNYFDRTLYSNGLVSHYTLACDVHVLYFNGLVCTYLALVHLMLYVKGLMVAKLTLLRLLA